MLSKKQLRNAALRAREALTDQAREDFNARILGQLIKHIPWRQLRVAHIFLSAPEKKEVDTQNLLNYLWKEFPKLQTVTNRIEADGLNCREIKPETALEKNAFDILEPKSESPLINPETIDFILIPLLACDPRGFRLGYGKGYYDQLLKKCPRAWRVGVNYFEPLLENIPNEMHDEALEELITPNGAVLFKNDGNDI